MSTRGIVPRNDEVLFRSRAAMQRLFILESVLNLVSYSIALPARHSSDDGIVRPRALAALRFIPRSDRLGCETGNSAGFEPLRILSS